MRNVAVVGAGMAGLACARVLADHGVPVTVFDKSRGLGGRMATRRLDAGFHFDHGAQYFTVRDERFGLAVDSWVRAGIVRPWSGRIVSLRDATIEPAGASTSRFVGVPGMNAICADLARDLDVRKNTHILPPSRRDDVWSLEDEAGHHGGSFDLVVVSTPAHQAALLLACAPALATRALSVTTDACWAIMAGFPSRLALDFDAAFVHGSSLAWIARNNSKPGRDPNAEAWVLHASADWTRAHLEDVPGSVERALLDAFWNATGVTPVSPVYLAAHRWRFAQSARPLDEGYLFDRDLGIGACGDWCRGPRVEGAFTSGTALADAMLLA